MKISKLNFLNFDTLKWETHSVHIWMQRQTVRKDRKFTTFLCYKGNVIFGEVYDVIEWRYLKIAKSILNFLKCYSILWNSTEFSWNVS